MFGASSFDFRCEMEQRQAHAGRLNYGWQRSGVCKPLYEHSVRQGLLGTVQPVCDLSLDTCESEKDGKSLRKDKNASIVVAM